MALAATVVWEVQTGGNDANGGGFDSTAAGTDYSQSTSPHVTIDGVTITAIVHTTTTQLNVVGYTVAAGDVGNLIKITGGTMTAGTYQITAADAVNNRWTVDRAAGTAAQTGTGRMGGCKKSPGETVSLLASGHLAWVKNNGTYTFTTTSAGADGPISWPNNVLATMKGYTTTRGDNGVVTVSAGSVAPTNMVSTAGSGATGHIENFIFDCNSQSIVAVAGASRMLFRNCGAKNGTNGFTSAGAFEYCYATGFSGSGFVFATGVSLFHCVSYSNTGVGFSLSTGASAVHCIAYSNTSDGFILSSGATTLGCTSYGNGGDGFDVSAGTQGSTMINCVSTGNTGYQYNNAATANRAQRYVNCAGKSDGTGIFRVTPNNETNIGFITLTADPFVNAASQDFKPNNTAGGGASLQAAATAPYGQTSYRDIGADQHQDSGGSTGKPSFGSGSQFNGRVA